VGLIVVCCCWPCLAVWAVFAVVQVPHLEACPLARTVETWRVASPLGAVFLPGVFVVRVSPLLARRCVGWMQGASGLGGPVLGVV